MNLKARFCTLAVLGIFLFSTVGIWAQSGKKPKSSRSSKRHYEEDTLQKVKVVFNPSRKQDPMLSPDDLLLIEHREKQRQAALAAERKRREEEERKRREEEERRRQWELALLKDPSMLIRDKIKIGGIIDKEVLIGNKLYTIGNTYMGAKIVAVGADSVTFSYKGHKFVKKVKL